MRSQRPARRYLPAVAVLVLFGLAYRFLVDPLNDWKVWRLSRELAGAPHPQGTQRISAQRRFGLLLGNGNHCDFFAGELRRFNGNRAQIRAAYDKMAIRNPVDGSESTLQVAFFENGRLPDSSVP